MTIQSDSTFNKMGFPLLRLPYLAQKSICDQFVPILIVTLSLCSKRASNLVRYLKCHSGKVKVVIDLQSDIRLRYDTQDDDFDQDIIYVVSEHPAVSEIVKLNGFTVPVVLREDERLNTYWIDVNEGLREVAKYACCIFNCNLAGLFLTDIPEAKWAVDWINSRQQSVKELIINTMSKYNATDDDLSYILNQLKVTERLEIVKPFKDRAHHPDIRMPSMELDDLEIQHGFWMTLEHVLGLNSRKYFFMGTNFTNHDLNLLLKHWTNGGFSRLREMSLIVMDPLNYNVILDGLDFVEVHVVRYYTDEYGKHINCVGFDIRREMDDVMVTLVYRREFTGMLEMFLTSELKFFV